MRFAVAICTWNRASRLAECLERLVQAEKPRSSWQLVVVNNCCTDDTDRVLDRYAARLPLLRVSEARPGLSNARNAAIAAIDADYVVWTDDDVLVDPGWLVAYERAFRRFPDAAVFGGPIRPVFEGTPPEWLAQIWDLVENAYAVRDLGPDEIALDGRREHALSERTTRSACASSAPFAYDPELGRRQQAGRAWRGDDGDPGDSRRGSHRAMGADRCRRPLDSHERQSVAFLRSYFALLGRTAHRGRVDEVATFAGRPRWAVRRLAMAECIYQFARLSRDSRRWLGPLIEASMLRGIVFDPGRPRGGSPRLETSPGRGVTMD